jgi:hypothetical protein
MLTLLFAFSLFALQEITAAIAANKSILFICCYCFMFWQQD